MRYQFIEVNPLAGALGAEVSGIDLGQPLREAVLDEIHQAFLDHSVIVFRDQNLTPKDQVELARRFGKPAIYPFFKGLDEAPEVHELLKTETDTVNFGGSWHSDTAYKPCPDMATLLYALEVPAAGGDTLFASMYRAYEALSDGMKQLLDGLLAVNNSEKGYGGARKERLRGLAGIKDAVRDEIKTFEAEHPVVRTHPQTGRKALYLSKSHTLRFKDMSVAESDPLINYLSEFAVRPEFTCRVRWRPRTLVIWDNRCTQHFAINDYQGQRRRMHRVTIEGGPVH
jgi:taurine dioxygenase